MVFKGSADIDIEEMRIAQPPIEKKTRNQQRGVKKHLILKVKTNLNTIDKIREIKKQGHSFHSVVGKAWVHLPDETISMASAMKSNMKLGPANNSEILNTPKTTSATAKKTPI